MKIQGRIISVEDVGGELRIVGQGWEISAPAGTCARRFEFTVDAVRGRAESYFVGRELTITVEPSKKVR